MRKTWLVLAAALVAPAPGCIVHERGYVGVGVGVAYDYHYVYYPGYSAYHCIDNDEWWVLDAGAWVHWTTRPAHIRITEEVAWVEVDEHGPEPFVHFEEHARAYPPGWKPDRPKGPPPGRGWRKDR